jgi:hypothetical protein
MQMKPVAGIRLSRSAQQQITGGVAAGQLCCTTPYGTECWSRSTASSNPNGDCRAIYPAYGNNVSGSWNSNSGGSGGSGGGYETPWNIL